jgi:hypothetical protein
MECGGEVNRLRVLLVSTEDDWARKALSLVFGDHNDPSVLCKNSVRPDVALVAMTWKDTYYLTTGPTHARLLRSHVST